MTGHAANDSPICGSVGPQSGTVVSYTAGCALRENLERLKAHRSSDAPAVFIAAATNGDQLVGVGTLGDLAERELDASGRPAFVIVGDVVGMRRMRT